MGNLNPRQMNQKPSDSDAAKLIRKVRRVTRKRHSAEEIRHIFAARMHPQTTGKLERLNRTAKSRLRLVVQSSPGELEAAVAEFAYWYNHERYHEAKRRQRFRKRDLFTL